MRVDVTIKEWTEKWLKKSDHGFYKGWKMSTWTKKGGREKKKPNRIKKYTEWWEWKKKAQGKLKFVCNLLVWKGSALQDVLDLLNRFSQEGSVCSWVPDVSGPSVLAFPFWNVQGKVVLLMVPLITFSVQCHGLLMWQFFKKKVRGQKMCKILRKHMVGHVDRWDKSSSVMRPPLAAIQGCW